MNINLAQTVAACLGNKQYLDALTLRVHEIMLEEDWVYDNNKRLKKIVRKLITKTGECLLASFIGKLAIRMPKLPLNEWHEFDRTKGQSIGAFLLVSMLMEAGEIPHEVRHEVGIKNGKKFFYPRTYLLLEGSSSNDKYKGCGIDSGVVLQKSYRGIYHSSDEKGFLMDVATQAFCINDACTEDLLKLGYSLKTDWNRTKDKDGRRLRELPAVKRRRYSKMVEAIIGTVKKLPKVYLSAKYCGRKRMYYDFASLEGVRPHGKEWEVSMWDSVDTRILTSDDSIVLKWVIYTTLHGKCSVTEANSKFAECDLDLVEPYMEATTESELGERLRLFKAVQALWDYRNGVPNGSLFGFDLTNSGLMMNAVSYRSPEMLEGGNLSGASSYVDSHMRFAKAFGLNLCRDDVKKIHMEVLHGGTAKSLQAALEALDTPVSLSIEEVEKRLYEAYGDCQANIGVIAHWGSRMYGNEQCMLQWKMPDGFNAMSYGHFEGVEMHLEVLSTGKSHTRSCTVVSEMPYKESKGFPIFGKDDGVDVKTHGLAADITHSCDAYVKRCVFRAVKDAGYDILLKHDDYIVPPAAYFVVQEAVQGALQVLWDTNMFQSALEQIAAKSPYNLPVPELAMGSAENVIGKSLNFLMV